MVGQIPAFVSTEQMLLIGRQGDLLNH